jgi:hypothetical protein
MKWRHRGGCGGGGLGGGVVADRTPRGAEAEGHHRRGAADGGDGRGRSGSAEAIRGPVAQRSGAGAAGGAAAERSPRVAHEWAGTTCRSGTCWGSTDGRLAGAVPPSARAGEGGRLRVALPLGVAGSGYRVGAWADPRLRDREW